MAAIKKNTGIVVWLIILGLWAALHLTMAKTVAAPVFDGELMGPDGYMRLIRVDDLRNGSGWYNSTIERSNAPYGDALHWTRPMDLLILLVSGIASLFGRGDAARRSVPMPPEELLEAAFLVYLRGLGLAPGATAGSG